MGGYLVGCWMNEVMVQIVFTLVFTFKIMKLITSKHIATHSCQTSKSKKDPEAEQVKEWKSHIGKGDIEIIASMGVELDY